MKELLKIAAALAAIAGAVAVVVKFGDKIISKLKGCKCCCCSDTPEDEAEAPAEEPAPEEAPEAAPEAPEATEEPEAPEAPASEEPEVTPEDFAD
ncbi:MAG: hypothetical protein MR473_03150 [Clostridiales bacterium]|nr:hypothetical protein [Clostridiales bacterium]